MPASCSKTCGSARALRLARQARLVVVNHALLLRDHEADGALIGSFEEVVVDEAHRLPGAALDARTEGWIAGLQMAALALQGTTLALRETLSMRDREDVAGFIKGFSGTNRYILDYLLEEVLAMCAKALPTSVITTAAAAAVPSLVTVKSTVPPTGMVMSFKGRSMVPSGAMLP